MEIISQHRVEKELRGNLPRVAMSPDVAECVTGVTELVLQKVLVCAAELAEKDERKTITIPIIEKAIASNPELHLIFPYVRVPIDREKIIKTVIKEKREHKKELVVKKKVSRAAAREKKKLDEEAEAKKVEAMLKKVKVAAIKAAVEKEIKVLKKGPNDISKKKTKSK